jgi:Tol biopolymer transport system component
VARLLDRDREPATLKVLAALAFAALVVVLVMGATQSASGATNGQWIVFSGAPNGLYPAQLFRIKTDGTGLKQLTQGAQSATDPAFSPKGTKVVFARLGKGIYSMKPDGSGQIRLTHGAHDLFPVWSPNGKSIAFVRLFKGDYRLFVMNANGKNLHRPKTSTGSGRPSWAPDSKSVFLPRGTIEKFSLVTNKYIGHYLYLENVPQSTAVSPNAKKVTFYAPRPSIPGCEDVSCLVFAVYVADIGGKMKRFVKDGGPAGWSPDNKRLVFVYRGGISLWTLAQGAGTHVQLATPNVVPAADAPPAWQPH